MSEPASQGEGIALREGSAIHCHCLESACEVALINVKVEVVKAAREYLIPKI